ncbi:MAG: DUF3489 domain-containing protein, partial [Fimbriimonadaceae bacterium]|nr:DUF3489 domain-containing protein [Alphaproteobacteria bacterium]
FMGPDPSLGFVSVAALTLWEREYGDRNMTKKSSSMITAPRAGSKQARLVSMLIAKKGVTIEKVCEALGWQPHTTRASLTGLRKRGYQIERGNGKPARYSISQEQD